MKRAFIFLTFTFIFLVGGTINVKADSAKFYEAETIDNIYLIRTDGFTNYYQKARFFRRTNDQLAAYCLEPFATFRPEQTYSSSNYLEIAKEKQERIMDLARFGYLAEGHTDPKWYAITQLMIWQEMVYKNNFYFTDTLNGTKIEPYNQEMDEINRLIYQSKIKPSFDGQQYHSVSGQIFTINDTNQVLRHYKTNAPGVTISNDTLSVKKEPGTYEITLTKEDNYHQSPALFYYSNNSQALLTVGNLPTTESKITVIFDELKLKIKKLSNYINHNHETHLEETEFGLFDEQEQLVTTIKLNNQNEAEISSKNVNLDYGTYYLKETKSGTGYILDETKYPIHFSPENTNVEITVSNDVIQKDITIQKFLASKDEISPEADAVFEIYDQENHLIATLTTGNDGILQTTLPFGHYTFKQIKGQTGYTLAEPFEVFINDTEENYYYQLYDDLEEVYEIEVPNTYTNQQSSTIPYIILGAGLFYVQKKLF